jgi:hypothetical protein
MDKYHPAARERQRQLIKDYYQEDLNELFRKLDDDVSVLGGPTIWAVDLILLLLLQLKVRPYPKLSLGEHSWRFYLYMHRLQPKLCKEWRFCEKVRNSQGLSRLELTESLVDFLIRKGVHHRMRVGIAAVALLSIDPKNLCGCENAE